MIEAKGIVVSVEGAQAEVRLDETGCGRCHEEGGCGGHNLGAMLCRNPRIYQVNNPAGAEVGQRVTVVVAEGAVRRSALLAYGLPLFALLLCAALGQAVAGDLGAIAGAGLGLLSGWGLSRNLQRRAGAEGWHQPYIRP
jgi:sigma-E factor negative regulatory protein RseC